MSNKSSRIFLGVATRNSLLLHRFHEIVFPQIGRDVRVLDLSKSSLGKEIESVDTLLWDIDSASSSDIELFIAYLNNNPHFDVIVLSRNSSGSADQTSQVLMAGARVLLIVPSEEEDGERWIRLGLDLKRELSLIQTRQNLRMIEQLTSSPQRIESKTKITSQPFDLIVIGASTGGPKALATIVSQFPKILGVPILCVQHMPSGFTQSLANGLDRASSFTVVEAQDNQIVAPNTFYLSPGGRHLTVIKQQNGNSKDKLLRLRLVDDPPVNNCRPSVDILFASVAKNFEGRVLAIILTGMGSDGLAGVKTLKEKQAYCITQDRASCTVYGMPRAVELAGLSDEQVSLNQVAQRILTLVRKI